MIFNCFELVLGFLKIVTNKSKRLAADRSREIETKVRNLKIIKTKKNKKMFDDYQS